MSTTRDVQFTAGLIADALVATARRGYGHRRYFFSGILDLLPSAVFEALQSRIDPDATVAVNTARGTVTLQCVPLYQGDPPPVLIPYLVGAPGPNAGSAGFAALLRDEIPQGSASRVLLILDSSPVETVRTAAEDAANLDGLRWEQLLHAAIAGATSTQVKALLEAVIRHDDRDEHLPRTVATIATLRDLAACEEPARAGALLHSLGYLRDPRAHTDLKRRLKEALEWRRKLESWASPDDDLEVRLRPLYDDIDTPGLKTVLSALTPFGLDYDRFELDDLPATARARVKTLRLAQPVRTRGASCASLPGRAAVWRPGGGTFSVGLASPAGKPATASIRWANGDADTTIPIRPGDVEIGIEVEEGTGWRYARIELPSGDGADLAIFLGTGDWAPFEASLDLDLNSSAFRCSEQPKVLALDTAGRVVGEPEVDWGDLDADGVPRPLLAKLRSESQPIDLLLDASETDDGPAPEPPEDGWPGGGDTPDPDPDPNEPRKPPLRVPSVPHARFLDGQSAADGGTATFFVGADGAAHIVTPTVYELASQLIHPKIEGLELERQVLARPDVLTFIMQRDGGTVALEPHPGLEKLVLTGLPEDVRSRFFVARAELFQVLEPHGSVHALGAGIGVEEARAYVDAYTALLDVMLEEGRFLAEYERLLLCDMIADQEGTELLIAPTSPVSVQYLLTLSDQIQPWLSSGMEIFEEDLASLTTRHLLPYFSMQGTWYESGGPAPLLWRRYRPQPQATPGDHRPGYIFRRIDHFLRVHPWYRDERQTISLAFHEPGDGSTVLAALRQLAKPLAAGSTSEHLPRLHVTIVSSNDAPTALERMVSGTSSSRPSEAPFDRVLKERTTVTRAVPHDGQPEFAHLSFMFRSSVDREPSAVSLDARAGTLYCGGLAASPGRHTEPGRNETAFHWGTFTGRKTSEGLPALVRKTLELVGGMPRDHIVRGRTRLPSTRIGSAFLGDVYESSAWVVHLDKLLGLEAFAPDASGRQARYLIDYEDRADPAQPGLDAITATSRVAPYRLALRKALAGLGRPTEAGIDRLLHLFNGVSGQWALDLVGASASDLHERVGLAAAIASLEDLEGGFEDVDAVGVVVPLREMIDAMPASARPEAGHLCDDLLYLRVPKHEARPRLRGRLLEVKYRGSTDPRAAGIARQQLLHAHAWLTKTYAVGNGAQNPFRSRDLAELIRGSVTRAAAFGLLNLDTRDALEDAIDAVARGDFLLDLTYEAGGRVLHGDFVSIEAESAVPAHRQPLPGDGLPLGHLRLGHPALEALAGGVPLPSPAALPAVKYSLEPAPRPAQPPEEDSQATCASADVSSEPAVETSQPADVREPARVRDRPAEVPIIAGRLDAAFSKYGLSVEPFDASLAQSGPSVIRFRTRTLGKLSITEVERRARDIGREIAAPGQVQVGDEPGFVTIDVPRTERQPVPLAATLPDLDAARGRPGALQFVVGVAPSGEVRVADLARLPHLLVAGATGSGKSVFLRGLLVALLRARTPEQLHLVIVDPKRLDFAPFARSPHVRGGTIISDPDEALERLRFTLEAELELRQPILEAAGVSSAAEFYEAGGSLEDLSQLVIIVDEFADIVLAGRDRKAFSELVQRYAQLTRAYGIYLVLATQRPSVDVVTGSIKANLSARVAFSLPSARDSMTVLDRGGAEDLLGDGDLLFYRNGRTERLQAPLATLADVRAVVSAG